MRIILKLFAAPFVLALTLAVAVLSFLFSLASWAFGVLSLLFAVCALFSIFIEGDTAWGIQGQGPPRFSLFGSIARGKWKRAQPPPCPGTSPRT